MKKRIALLLVLVLALSFVLASCGTKECETHTDADIDEVCDVCGAAVPFTPTYLGFEGYYNTACDMSDVDDPAYTTVAETAFVEDYTHAESRGNNLVFFYNTNAEAGEKKLVVVNTDTMSVVYSLNKERTVAEGDLKADTYTKSASASYAVDGDYVIVENTLDTSNEYSYNYITTIYTALGQQIASKSSKTGYASVSSLNNGLFAFDGKAYSMKDDVATYKFDLGLSYIPSCSVSTAKYNYDFAWEESMMSEIMYAVIIYDANYKYVATYEKPADIDSMRAFVLSDGNILIQLTDELASDATEYDYIAEGYTYGYMSGVGMTVELVKDVKYSLTTLVYNVETKTATEVDFNYVIDGLYSEATDEDFTDTFVAGKLDNFVEYYEIVDKAIDTNNVVYANLRSSDLKVLGFLGQEIPDQYGLADLVANNRFVVEDKSGKTYLLNEKGEVIGDITGVDIYEDGRVWDKAFIYKDGKYYDENLQVVLDRSTIDYKSYSYSFYRDTYKVITDGGEEVRTKYYAFYNAAFVELAYNPQEDVYRNCGEDFFAYTDIVKVEGAANESYHVVLNAAGAEIQRVKLGSTTVKNADNVDVVTTVGAYTTEVNGVVYTKVTTTTSVGGAAPTSTYNYYIAK